MISRTRAPAYQTYQIAATAVVSLAAIHLAGGPPGALAMQAAAFVLAVAITWRRGVAARLESVAPYWPLGAVLLLACAVLLAGVDIDGARRWLRIGPVLLHPASLLGPVLLAALARTGGDWRALVLAGLAVLAFGLGVDGAASLAFALGLSGLCFGGAPAWRRRRLLLCAPAWGLALWGWTRPDSLPALPYVEEVVARSFAAAPALGAAAAAALALLPLPFLAAARGAATPESRGRNLALAGFWLGLALAGVAGNYPVPVIGYGASPVIGWIVALSLATGADDIGTGITARAYTQTRSR